MGLGGDHQISAVDMSAAGAGAVDHPAVKVELGVDILHVRPPKGVIIKL